MPILSDDLDRESLRRAVNQSLRYLSGLPPDRVIGERPRRLTVLEVRDSLRTFGKILERRDCPGCWIEEVRRRFQFVPAVQAPGTDNVLVTGYFQPVVEASLSPTAEYKYPLYRKPADLIVAEEVTLTPELSVEKVVGRIEGAGFLPYYSRREIDEHGALRGRGEEIAWAKDPIDLFFLHVQGSGMLRLRDGRLVHANFAASNGRPYRSIGKLLVERGRIPPDEVSMQRLRRYLLEHPEERNEILAYNERYVFFRFVDEGPLGSLEVPLTPGRSIATDSRIYPKGALGLLASNKPVLNDAGELIGWQPFSRFVLNQDTGSAIRGHRRVDLYFGSGDAAGSAAGYMNAAGKLFFLVPKSGSAPTTR